MKKNVASQSIGAQMVSATDGSAFTSAVTIYVCLDRGTQAIGTVGSGACTHEGNGYHTYAPSQAETNGDLAAFTFIGTGAVPSTVQVYTSFPQTVDNATNITSIKTKTDFLPSATAGAAGGVFIAGTNAATTITTGLTTTFTGNLTGSVGSVATDGITSGSLAASAITEIQSGLATPTNITAGTITTCTNVTTVNGLAANTVTASALATDAVTEIQSGLATSANQTTMDGKLDTIDNFVDTEVAAIKAVTDKLDTALELDGAVYRYTTNALEQAPTGGSAPSAATVADAVWDEVLSDHLTAGTTGAALNGAGSAGDPWGTAVPGAYGAGTAGKILGDNLNATVSSRATQTSVDTIDDLLDTEVAAIKTDTAAIKLKTDNLPTDPADASDIAASFATVNAGIADLPTNAELATALGTSDDAVLVAIGDLPTNAELATALGTSDDAVLAQVALVKAKTDSLTFTSAGKVDSHIVMVNGVTVDGTGATGDTWGPA